jgi:hypothetical protein
MTNRHTPCVDDPTVVLFRRHALGGRVRNDPIAVVNLYYGPFAAAPGWSDAGTIIPWLHWVHYGNRGLLEAHFDSARRWVDTNWAQNKIPRGKEV